MFPISLKMSPNDKNLIEINHSNCFYLQDYFPHNFSAVKQTVPANFNVSIVSPFGTPAVLDQPELVTIVFFTIADQEHTMIKTLWRTVGVTVDSMTIELK